MIEFVRIYFDPASALDYRRPAGLTILSSGKYSSFLNFRVDIVLNTAIKDSLSNQQWLIKYQTVKIVKPKLLCALIINRYTRRARHFSTTFWIVVHFRKTVLLRFVPNKERRLICDSICKKQLVSVVPVVVSSA